MKSMRIFGVDGNSPEFYEKLILNLFSKHGMSNTQKNYIWIYDSRKNLEHGKACKKICKRARRLTRTEISNTNTTRHEAVKKHDNQHLGPGP